MKFPRFTSLALMMLMLPAAVFATPYVDKVLSESDLWVDQDVVEEAEAEEGPSRSFRIEAVGNLTKSSSGSQSISDNEQGFILGGHRDTENYGVISADASLHRDGGYGTIWQRNFQFGQGNRADTGLGLVNHSALQVTGSQYRFFLPMSQINGLTTRMVDSNGNAIVFGSGSPVVLQGIRVYTMDRLPGTVSSMGYEKRFSQNWSAGVLMMSANGTKNPWTNEIDDSMTGIGSIGYKGIDFSAKLNVLQTNGAGSAVWFDSSYRQDKMMHYMGAFSFGNNLTWGTMALNSNQKGVYYRGSYGWQQWQVDGGVDYLENTQSPQSKPLQFYTGNARYQYSSAWGIGIGANARTGETEAWSTSAYVDNKNELGSTRVNVQHAQDKTRQGQQVTLDHLWKLTESYRLSTGVTLRKEVNESITTKQAGLVVSGGAQTGKLNLDGQAQWFQKGDNAPASTYVNVNANWQVDKNWSVNMMAYKNKTEAWKPLTVTSPVNPQVEVPQVTGSGLFLSVKYAFGAGRSSAPMGGRPGDAGGRISGVIFFDQDGDGRQGPGEQGIANLVIIMDGVYGARTNAAGFYSFASVARGQHQIEIQPDNLPLPWLVTKDGLRSVEVDVRETTTLNIGAIR